MRVIAPLFIVLLAAMCRTSAPAPGNSASQDLTPAFRVLASGAYGASASRNVESEPSSAAIEIARDERSYIDAWGRIAGAGAPPAVDFSKESVVFLELGIRSSGGWSVAPRAVEVDGYAARVEAHVMKPEGRTITTMAFTAPFSVVAVSNRSFTRAEWVDAGGEVIARGPRQQATE